ncbi:hypothetical protein [Nodularia spumigena]|uniref:hypothetical protein n=1 Tax=Nodularia spumigena TaxID=70799 RepID=UPI001379F49F|nr:hypothetical protein [Nodularia spumigena]
MANIQIFDLELVQTEFAELSHMELESIIGGRTSDPTIKVTVDKDGTITITITPC